jgi:hypothetical protein
MAFSPSYDVETGFSDMPIAADHEVFIYSQILGESY